MNRIRSSVATLAAVHLKATLTADASAYNASGPDWHGPRQQESARIRERAGD
jgi:hypothetical protein